MNLADIQAAYYMVATTGVLIAAIYYIINLRFNMRARAMEICRLHTSDFVSEQGIQREAIVRTMEWKDDEEFMKKYMLSNPEMYSKWVSHFFMMEASGLLIKNKVVKPEMFYALGGFGAPIAWEKFKDFFQRARKDVDPSIFCNTEFFIQEMQKIRTRNAAQFKETLKLTYRQP